MRFVTIILIHTIPAGCFLVHAQTFRGEYYYAVNQITAGVFLLAALGIGIWNAGPRSLLLERPCLVLFLSMLFSWLLALFVFGLANLTSLCIGRDNGDGINGLNECVIYSVLSSVANSALIVPIVTLTAVIGRWVVRYFSRPGLSHSEPKQ